MIKLCLNDNYQQGRSRRSTAVQALDRKGQNKMRHGAIRQNMFLITYPHQIILKTGKCDQFPFIGDNRDIICKCFLHGNQRGSSYPNRVLSLSTVISLLKWDASTAMQACELFLLASNWRTLRRLITTIKTIWRKVTLPFERNALLSIRTLEDIRLITIQADVVPLSKYCGTVAQDKPER